MGCLLLSTRICFFSFILFLSCGFLTLFRLLRFFLHRLHVYSLPFNFICTSFSSVSHSAFFLPIYCVRCAVFVSQRLFLVCHIRVENVKRFDSIWCALFCSIVIFNTPRLTIFVPLEAIKYLSLFASLPQCACVSVYAHLCSNKRKKKNHQPTHTTSANEIYSLKELRQQIYFALAAETENNEKRVVHSKQAKEAKKKCRAECVRERERENAKSSDVATNAIVVLLTTFKIVFH